MTEGMSPELLSAWGASGVERLEDLDAHLRRELAAAEDDPDLAEEIRHLRDQLWQHERQQLAPDEDDPPDRRPPEDHTI